MRLRDLALVDLDALTAGHACQADMIAAFAEDVVDAMREARTRMIALRTALGGADPLSVLDVTARLRASDAGTAGVGRVQTRLAAQAEACRALGRLADLAATLVPKLFEADRRR